MSDILVDNKLIYNLEYYFIRYFFYLVQFTFILFMVGILQEKSVHLLEFNFIVKALLGLFLMYRFNRYRTVKITFTELDRKVIYSSGLYIIVLSFADLLDKYTKIIRSHIIKYTVPVLDYIKKKL